MFSKQDIFREVFHDPSSSEKRLKEVEFIRVDGATDEGPSHHEGQFLWTERHLSLPTKVRVQEAVGIVYSTGWNFKMDA